MLISFAEEMTRVALQNLRCAFGDVAVINAVKFVAADAFGQPFVWAGVDVRGGRQRAVKPGVEDGDLRRGGN